MSLATEGWDCVLSGVNSSGAVQLMDALVSENGSNMIVFRPKSARRARGGWLSLIRIFDCRNLQKGIDINDRNSKTYPSHVPVYKIHPVKEL
jgi:hypothetical protein